MNKTLATKKQQMFILIFFFGLFLNCLPLFMPLSIAGETSTNDQKEQKDLLSSLEKFALLNYTSTDGSSKIINEFLRKNMGKYLYSPNDCHTMDSALKKLPAWKGKSYRGADLPYEEINRVLKMKKGDIYYDKAYLSTSRDIPIAKTYYSKKGDSGFLFEIDGISGRNLGDLGYGNTNGVEAEVLFPRETKFVIESISNNIIKMIEVGVKENN